MFNPPRFVLDHTLDLVSQTVDHLREQIVTLGWAPGQRLTRAGLARQLQAPPAVVEAAFRQLSGERLIEKTDSGVLVRPIDVRQAREAWFVRLALELEVARRLAAAGAPKLGLLAALVDLQRASLEAGEADGLARAEQLFNRQLYDAAGVGALWDDAGAGRGQLDRIARQQLGLRKQAERLIERQRELLAAIARRDRNGACAAVRLRLELLLSDVGVLRARQPAWFIDDDVPPARSRTLAQDAPACAAMA